MKAKKQIKILILLIFAILLSHAACAAEKSFKVKYIDASGNPSNSGLFYEQTWQGVYSIYYYLYVYDANLEYIYNEPPLFTMEKSTDPGEEVGVLKITYDDAVTTYDEVILTAYCFRGDSASTLFKKINLQSVTGQMVVLDCNEESISDIPSPGSKIKKVKLIFQFEDGTPYDRNYYFYATWLAESNGFGYDISWNIYGSARATSILMLNEGKYSIYIDDPKVDGVKEIEIDRDTDYMANPVIIKFQKPSTTLNLRVLKNGEPVGWGIVETYILGNWRRYSYGWIDGSGYAQFYDNSFLPGTYSIWGCCGSGMMLWWCDPSWNWDEEIYPYAKTITFAENEQKDVTFDCGGAEVDIRTETEDGIGVPAHISTNVYLDGTKTLLYSHSRYTYDSDDNGNLKINLSEGEYDFDGTYMQASGSSEKVTLTAGQTASAKIVFPATNAKINLRVLGGPDQPLNNTHVYLFSSGDYTYGYTGEDGYIRWNVYDGIYSAFVSCYVPETSSYSWKQQEINVAAGETKDVDILCFGSEIHPVIIEEYKENNVIKRRPLYIKKCDYYNWDWGCWRYYNTNIWLYQNGVNVGSSYIYSDGVFNVTPGIYDLNVNLQYNAFPQPAIKNYTTCQPYPCLIYEGKGKPCDTYYHITYKDLDASKPGVYYAEIIFRTWMFNDTNCNSCQIPTRPECNPFGNFYMSRVGEVIASDFNPSSAFLIALVLSLSLLLAFLQAKKPEPKGK